LRFAIIGCGLIGQKRARTLGAHKLVVASDTAVPRAETLASQFAGAEAVADWRAAVERPEVEVVVVCTTNNWLAPIAAAAASSGKHVLVEKPAARSVEEIDNVIAACQRSGVQVAVGFNHRYHPSFQRARELVDSDALGPLLYIRARYGHGGRLGYEQEWRADRSVAGGGEMLDQGVHLIDLSRWFLGEFTSVEGFLGTYYWQMPVEDNSFLSLRTSAGQMAWLHASWSEWKNTFSFEIFGRAGKLQIDGLGGSYGTERLTHYRMLPELGPPETTIWEYPGDDRSWDRELEAFVEAIQEGRRPSASIYDARAVFEITTKVYEMNGVTAGR
jgi:predicted dehydrogenase